MHASAGWYGDHTVDATSDGVTVRKGLDLDTLALPALKFEIRSERDDPVGVRVVDRLPATIDPERVGVHADFAADQWTAFEDGRVTFTTRLDPERPVVTLYGIWMDDPSRVHELLGSPDVMVSSNPDAPSLEPVGDEVHLPTVDDSLRSVGPDALADLRADVEETLTAVRAEPSDTGEETPTAMPATGAESDDDAEDPAGTMGDHAWTYPVERMGTGRIATPTHADLDDLVDDDIHDEHVYLRAALAETHHGGGGAVLLQELANAFEVVARRVTGDDERSTVDAVVQTPLGTDAVLSALSDRDQVTDALVSPLVGDRSDATGIDAMPEEATAAAERDGTEEVSIEPDTEDVEVVLNADGDRFDELKSEFEYESDTGVMEDELAELELPGVDTSEEPSIDELVDGADFDDGEEAAFVPASVTDDDEMFEFDDGDFDDDADDDVNLDFSADADEDHSGLDFASDAAAADGNGTDAVTPETESGAETESETEQPFDFDDEVEAGEDSWASSAADEAAFEFDGASEQADAAQPAGDDGADSSVVDPVEPPAESEPEADDGENVPVADDAETTPDTVEVPVTELAALRTEIRELRDRVATLESDLAAVRADTVRRNGSANATETESDESASSRSAGSNGSGDGSYGREENGHADSRGRDEQRPLTDGDGSVDPAETEHFEVPDVVESTEVVESADVVEGADDAE